MKGVCENASHPRATSGPILSITDRWIRTDLRCPACGRSQGIRMRRNINAPVEAVATTALEHPEWDMDETRTWAEWDQS